MADSVSLKLTLDSKAILNRWARDKTGKVERIIDTWLQRMQAWMLRETVKSFDDGAQPGGQAWPPNVGRYAAWKSSIGSNKPGILRGDLRRSFAQNKQINKAMKQASIGSTLPYANAVYYGKSSGWAGEVTGSGGNKAWFRFSGMRARPYFPTVKRGEDHAADLFNQLAKKYLA